jgi:hypothetical protein
MGLTYTWSSKIGPQLHRSHSIFKYSLIDEFLTLDKGKIATVH